MGAHFLDTVVGLDQQLDGAAAGADQAQIALMYAQAESTLAVLTEIAGVRLIVNGQQLDPWRGATGR